MRGGSFTESVVAELAPHLPPLPHCRAALLEGMSLTGDPAVAPGGLETPRAVAARCAVAILHADGRSGHAVRVRAPRRAHYRVDVPSGGPIVTPNNCCRRSRLRGAFLALGSVNRPERPPHLEIPVRDSAAAELLLGDLGALEVPASIRMRRLRPVVTVRSATAVGAALSSIGAQGGRLAYEQGRVVRDVRAGVNRTINAETANLRRTVDAAVRQLDAAERLCADIGRWESLPPALRAAAELRRAHPDASLGPLAEHAGISRPAMAGRLQRLVEAARQ
ncbi:MAG: DNA-binding protein WhiA [Candidatus Aeolococcus gillhamiae]|uniref:DNA-binding protein WhiA n=1 Tax=Candidatus Aeolococcus gillhamiae TaxID=3127015 RepID=A0A2W5ZD55_9BACT|nr:MAG: DNA-binding protein WhiA [Candidatus Dormibacter sp. RRmetagenome_bin12]